MENKAKFCIGLNGQPDNMTRLMGEFGDAVYEVFSPAPPDVINTGRRGHVPTTEAKLSEEVKLAHDNGVRYNVLMNGICQYIQESQNEDCFTFFFNQFGPTNFIKTVGSIFSPSLLFNI